VGKGERLRGKIWIWLFSPKDRAHFGNTPRGENFPRGGLNPLMFCGKKEAGFLQKRSARPIY